MIAHRTFVPSHSYSSSSVERWIWNRSRGLFVVYKDHVGLGRLKSDYGTLRAFLKAVREGREHAVEQPREA